MSARGRELVATDEPTIITKPLLNAVVVENSQSNGSLPDPACANKSNGREFLNETNDLQD